MTHLLLKLFRWLNAAVVHRIDGVPLRALLLCVYRLVFGEVLASFVFQFVDLPGGDDRSLNNVSFKFVLVGD
jgi:hypothetical protein